MTSVSFTLARLLRAGGILLLVFFLALPGVSNAEPEFPELTGRVVDKAGLLSQGQEHDISEKLRLIEQKTSAQVVVATLPSLQGYDIRDFGYRLGRHWGIGQKDKDNGVLLIVAPIERKVAIEVGYGLEAVLTDALSKLIIEHKIIPHFKQGNFAYGIIAAVDDIGVIVAQDEHAEELKRDYSSPDEGLSPIAIFILIIVLIIIINNISGGGGPFIILGGPGSSGRSSRRSSGGWSGGGGGWSGGGGSFGGGGASGGW